MKKVFCDFLNEKLLPFMFKISNKPVSLSDMLEANKQISDGLIPDSTILGFRMQAGKSYLVFIALSHIVIIPAVGILHSVFTMVDCHASILLAVLFTSIFFASFTMFREYIVDKMGLKQLKNSWKIHFPFFEFDEYHEDVAHIYLEAVKKKLPKSELEFFVLEELSKLKK